MKTVAIAVMLLATTAFGAASISVTPLNPTAAAGDTIAFQFKLNNPEQLAVVGFDIGSVDITASGRTFLKTPASGARSNVNAELGSRFGFGTADSALNGKTLNALGDLGGTSNDSVVSANDLAGSMDLFTLNTVLQAGAPATIQFKFNGSVVNRTGIDDVFGDGSLLVPVTGSTAWEQVVTVVTPEPASMLLLAVGGAFFARRRRA